MSRNSSDKERIISILGWMHAEEARALFDPALKSGRAIDLTWLLRLAEGDARELLAHLRRVVESDPALSREFGPWADEWVQKRLVQALYRLSISAARADMERLQAHIRARSAAKDLVQVG